jgi:hypothetical protein
LLGLASWPWWINRFLLRANTQFVEISTSAPAIHVIGLPLLDGVEIQIFDAHADGLPPELSSLAAASVTLRLVVSNATLQSISLPSGAGLVVRVRPNGGVDIGVLNDGSISLAISGTIDRIADNGRRTTVANIERATVLDVRPAEKNNPARIVLPPGAAPIAIYNQPIDSFRFGRARPTGDDPRTFQSEILDGEIQILDTGTSIELQPHELVLLEGGTRQLSRLEITDKSIAVDISGEADRISAGPPRTGVPFRLDRDLTPSVLSYLVGQHELKLLWGLAVVVLGALWKARQWALEWEK